MTSTTKQEKVTAADKELARRYVKCLESYPVGGHAALAQLIANDRMDYSPGEHMSAGMKGFMPVLVGFMFGAMESSLSAGVIAWAITLAVITANSYMRRHWPWWDRLYASKSIHQNEDQPKIEKEKPFLIQVRDMLILFALIVIVSLLIRALWIGIVIEWKSL